ncbi:D-beta-hydroxybutyrate dehydrogenase, mitochondrial [Tupaia chinensis]|uniref:D-beta-hydroxybutyrate dehydrogenase, mitochondrial n=1 Tax=Tupaia chinensis TaxID=246437 RepID=L9JKE4_TUPCH|nr:D-beta-hydroxybutyrate dehydrogenase, mitochondrial [Tupaia chinensis]
MLRACFVFQNQQRKWTCLPLVTMMLAARLSRPLAQIPGRTLSVCDRENGTTRTLLFYSASFAPRRTYASEVDPVGSKAVLVTGCDSGFGFSLAKHLHSKGFLVFAGCLMKDGIRGVLLQQIQAAEAPGLHAPLKISTCRMFRKDKGGDGVKELDSLKSDRLRTVQLNVCSSEEVEKVVEIVRSSLKDPEKVLQAQVSCESTRFFRPCTRPRGTTQAVGTVLNRNDQSSRLAWKTPRGFPGFWPSQNPEAEMNEQALGVEFGVWDGMRLGMWGLVNNAGISTFGEVEFTSMDTYKQVAEVNLWGTVRMTKSFLPLIRRAKGRVVNISSMLGRMANPARSPYCITKFGVEAFSDCLRYEMYPLGVKVSVVEPGNFIAATSLYSPESIQAIARKMWDDLPEVVRQDYGRKYFDEKIARMQTYCNSGSTDTSPVIDAVTHALTAATPYTRYHPMDYYWWLRMQVMTHLPGAVSDMIYIH